MASNTVYRQKMVTALEATEADGASIQGTESEVTITLTFKREVNPCTKSCSDSPSLTCCGGYANNDNELRGSNMELPQGTEAAPVRSWKRWFLVNTDGSPATGQPYSFNCGGTPYTVLEGHDAIERIEREAYEQGRRHGMITATEAGPCCAIDGVSPVVVDGWRHCDKNDEIWQDELMGDGQAFDALRVFKHNCDVVNVPCRVHLYPGVNSEGKKV